MASLKILARYPQIKTHFAGLGRWGWFFWYFLAVMMLTTIWGWIALFLVTVGVIVYERLA